MNDHRTLKTVSPLSGTVWEQRLGVDPSAVPHYAHNEHLPVFFYGGWASSMASLPFEAPMCTLVDELQGQQSMLPRIWETREHWFHAHKPQDATAITAIWRLSDPWAAKRLGNSRNAFVIRPDWDEGVSYEVMLEGIRHQLAEYPWVAQQLRETGDRFIAEVSPTDTIWGIYNRDSDTWDGQNLLGAAWMEARSEL